MNILCVGKDHRAVIMVLVRIVRLIPYLAEEAAEQPLGTPHSPHLCRY